MARPTDHPTARTSGLVTKEAAGEVLVYDLDRHRAHRLNPPAAAVWRRCDGARTVTEITAAVRADGTPVTEALVRHAVLELGRARLLTEPAVGDGLTRRAWLQRLGPAAAVALPVVSSITVPRAAEAQSGPSVVCLGSSDECTNDRQCCGPPLCDEVRCTCVGLDGSSLCLPPPNLRTRRR